MKKLIPFAVLEKIQPLLDKYRDSIKILKDPKYAIIIKDADPKSDFFFRIRHQDGNDLHHIEFHPLSEKSLRPYSMDANLQELVSTVTNWLTLLDKYNQLQTVFDDPMLEAHANTFFEVLKMNEDDADQVPFDPIRMLYLDQYIEAVKLILQKYEESTDLDSKKMQLEEIKEDCEALQEQLSSLPKNKVVKYLAKIWAKSSKYSIALMKEFLAEFKKETVKWIAKQMYEGEGSFFNQIKGLIE
ncbi:hypothetical protein [Runella zeae]|uniref:hypothetical protein n=1 Tax=Runella zeae TaxID=94255 RepID=UPI000491956C|nr:hypothetical protein [Runella zeae]